MDDRAKAMKRLQPLCQLSPDQITREDLEAAAKWLLCTGQHRETQVREMASQWYIMLKKYIANPPPVKQEDQRNYLPEARALQKQLRAEKQQRQDDNSAMAAEIEQLQDHLSKIKVEKLSFKYKNLELDREVTDLRLRLDGEQEENSRLQAQLSESKRVIEEKDELLRLEREKLDWESVASKEQSLEIDTLKTENETLERSMEEQNLEIDTLKNENGTLEQSVKEQEIKHQKSVDDLRSQLQVKDEALLDMTLQRDKVESTLKQQKQDADATATELRAQNQKLVKKSHFHVFRTQVQFMIKQRRYDELMGDKQALLHQQKVLQQDMSGLCERFISPMKLPEVKKGICTVLAVQPLRFQMKRLSNKGFSDARTIEDAVS
ncbi:MAG: hypothetical protein Q9164_002351 [Protoblastenia rupestris]